MVMRSAVRSHRRMPSKFHEGSQRIQTAATLGLYIQLSTETARFDQGTAAAMDERV